MPNDENLTTGGKKGTVIPSSLLRAMRHAFKKPMSEDNGSLEIATCRKLLNEDAKAFTAQLQRMEEAHANRRLKAAKKDDAGPADETEPTTPQPPRVTAPDAGTDRALMLIDKLLASGATDGWD